jgi:hypothetical protein
MTLGNLTPLNSSKLYFKGIFKIDSPLLLKLNDSLKIGNKVAYTNYGKTIFSRVLTLASKAANFFSKSA